MAENLMNSAHKATNKPYRDNYDRIFGNRIINWNNPEDCALFRLEYEKNLENFIVGLIKDTECLILQN